MRIRMPEHIRRHGAAATELALILPFLALIFFVVLDYSRVFHYTQVIQSSADIGAKYASGHANPPPSTVDNNLLSMELGDLELLSIDLFDTENEEVNIKQQLAHAAIEASVREGKDLNPPLQPKQVAVVYNNNQVVVRVTYEFHTLTPFFAHSRKVVLNRKVVMKLAPHLYQ